MLERGQHLASKQLADFIWYEGSRHQISWPFAFIWERTECAVGEKLSCRRGRVVFPCHRRPAIGVAQV